MLTPEQLKEFRNQYHNAKEQEVEVILRAICKTIQNITGVYPNERFREKLYETIRFDV